MTLTLSQSSLKEIFRLQFRTKLLLFQQDAPKTPIQLCGLRLQNALIKLNRQIRPSIKLLNNLNHTSIYIYALPLQILLEVSNSHLYTLVYPYYLVLTLSLYIPIDINVTQKFLPMPKMEQSHYRDPNHLIQECPVKIDIRQLTICYNLRLRIKLKKESYIRITQENSMEF